MCRQMTTAIRFSEAQIEALAKHLGECGTGSDITRMVSAQRPHDDSGQITKWRCLYWVFLNIQRRDRSANAILTFVKSCLELVRFADRSTDFEIMRSELNRILAFSGLN